MSSAEHSLNTLDVSGNLPLGNAGALQLLEACRSGWLWARGDSPSQANVLLQTCGIESPLSDEFAEVVKQLSGKEGCGVAGSRTPFKIDLFGNLIDPAEMDRLLD